MSVTRLHLSQPLRLFGASQLTREQRLMLRECDRLLELVDSARVTLGVALMNGDPDLCIESCRRLQSLGFLLGEQARSVS